MKVLVIAREGQIRDALEKQLTLRKRSFDSAGPEWLATPQSDTLPPPIPADITVVVNAFSLESVQQLADESLIDHLGCLAQACAKSDVPLILLSSSQVFDGLEGGVHREVDAAVPVSRCGALLLRMEDLVRGICDQHIILRTGSLFSSMGNNLLTTLLETLKFGGTLQLSNSGDSSPLHTSDLARVISAIIDQLSCGARVWGTYHYSSADYVSRYQFAEVVLSAVVSYLKDKPRPVLEAVDVDDPNWSRPLLNCDKILNTFGIKQLPWRAFIAPTARKYFNPELASDEPVLNQSILPVQKENFDG